MGLLTRIAVRIYPRWWRERYGEEFQALLDDTRPGLGGTLDIMMAAIAMQLMRLSGKQIWLLGTLSVPTIMLAIFCFVSPVYQATAAIRLDVPENISLPEWRAAVIPISKKLRGMEPSLIRELRLRPDANAHGQGPNLRLFFAPQFVGNDLRSEVKLTFLYPDRQLAYQTLARVVQDLEKQGVKIGAASKPLFPYFDHNRKDLLIQSAVLVSVLGGLAGLLVYLRRHWKLTWRMPVELHSK